MEKQRSEILTPDECADLLRVSTRTVRKLSDNGEIPSFRVGNQVRFLRDDVIDRLRGQAQDEDGPEERPRGE